MRTAESLRFSTRSSLKNVDIWTRILCHLDMSELKTARLFCSTSRMASLPFIKSLPFERCPDNEDSLIHCLGVFPFVASIALSIQLPQHAAKANLLDLPTVRSKLCKLRLSLPPKSAPPAAAQEAIRNLDDMIPNLMLAANLTSLELRMWPGFNDTELHASPSYQFLRVLRVCWALRELTLGAALPYFRGLTHEAVLGLTSLGTLHVTPNRIFPWGKLLENPARLTHLSCLDTVHITNRALIFEDDNVVDGELDFKLARTFAYVNHVVTLTQLTCLKAFCGWHQYLGVPFSKLAALEVLRLDCFSCLRFQGNLHMIISKMSKLRELELHCRALAPIQIRELDDIVAPFLELTRLRIEGVDCGWDYPIEAFRQDGIAGLRDISLRLSPNVATRAFSMLQACHAWTRLERLELDFLTCDGLPEITRWDVMPSMTQLILKSPRIWGRIWPRVDLRPRFASASFLSKLPQLQHLQLHFVLDAHRMDNDIAHLAALTKLTHLQLCTQDPPEPVCGTPLSELGTKLQPLSALRKLEQVVLVESGQYLENAKGLYEKLRSVRKEMGLHPTRFDLRRFADP
jgi:hypothetical protein